MNIIIPVLAIVAFFACLWILSVLRITSNHAVAAQKPAIGSTWIFVDSDPRDEMEVVGYTDRHIVLEDQVGRTATCPEACFHELYKPCAGAPGSDGR